jgi:CubicO group peptidase (beta-lactamase class C family)
MIRIAPFAALLAVLLTTSSLASATASSPEQRLKPLFANWSHPGTPGAVVEVIRDNKILLTRSYGAADLEHHIPVTASTAFTVGSMSKQFTAFSIHLLAQDGKLSLDDDIRTYVPEVPDFGTKITLRHLLHHTSGLRDYFGLMLLTGWRGDDVITQGDALTMVARQRALNFAPGQEYLYSNSGYMLLGLVVERVSGKPLAAFARERIFAPLGMRHTQFLHGYGTVVPGHARSYVRGASGGYDDVAVGDAADGAGGLVTTAGDLALWDQNFYDGRVGGKALLARMQETGVLNDGKPIEYASGLIVDAHRGRRVVLHGGTIGGFQSELLRFPDQHLSVIVLANTSDIDMYRTVRKIADIYLEPGRNAPPDAPKKVFKEVQLDPSHLRALAGYYALSPHYGIDFTEEHGQLMAKATDGAKLPVFAYGERNFFAKVLDAQFTFDAPGPDGVVSGGVLHRDGQDIPARRIVRPVLSAAALRKFEGDFYSDELRVLYSVKAEGGGLVLTWPRGAMALDVNEESGTAAGFPLSAIRYECPAPDACTGFTVDTGRVRNLQFMRVALKPTSLR